MDFPVHTNRPVNQTAADGGPLTNSARTRLGVQRAKEHTKISREIKDGKEEEEENQMGHAIESKLRSRLNSSVTQREEYSIIYSKESSRKEYDVPGYTGRVVVRSVRKDGLEAVDSVQLRREPRRPFLRWPRRRGHRFAACAPLRLLGSRRRLIRRRSGLGRKEGEGDLLAVRVRAESLEGAEDGHHLVSVNGLGLYLIRLVQEILLEDTSRGGGLLVLLGIELRGNPKGGGI